MQCVRRDSTRTVGDQARIAAAHVGKKRVRLVDVRNAEPRTTFPALVRIRIAFLFACLQIATDRGRNAIFVFDPQKVPCVACGQPGVPIRDGELETVKRPASAHGRSEVLGRD